MVDRPSACQLTNTPVSVPATTTGAVTKSKENPYAKPGDDKYYRCGELGTSCHALLHKIHCSGNVTRAGDAYTEKNTSHVYMLSLI